MKIGIVGGGWYGCHLALSLAKLGYEVVLFERNSDIFTGVSGKFGIRLHKGPHYPRSKSTRQHCRESFHAFRSTYPELVVDHEYSVYALGTMDADGNPPKVDVATFDSVCRESEECRELKLDTIGYQNLHMAMTIEEPSVVLGDRLRNAFWTKLAQANVTVICNYPVEKLSQLDEKTVLTGHDGTEHYFDKIINSTGYQSLIPDTLKDDFPLEMEVIYQPCLALIYKDLRPGEKPFSFIVMDGWFPCLMPCIDSVDYDNTYILTHGSYTIMASCATATEASAILDAVTDTFIEDKVKPSSASEMARFWPEFSERFEYQGWKGAVLAKLVTKCEFRSAVTFEHKNVINIIPGKVSNIFDAQKEVTALLERKNCLSHKGTTYVAGGVLDGCRGEIAEKPSMDEPSTCRLNTWRSVTDNTVSKAAQSFFARSSSASDDNIEHQPRHNP